MNHDTGNSPLHYPYAKAPAPGTLQEIAPRVFWLRMPMPGRLNHINLWVLDDGDGVTLIDTGVATDETKSLWTEIFAGPLAGRRVKRLVCTHHHPDHMGLAGWLVETHGVPFVMSAGEWAFVQRFRSRSPSAVSDSMTRFYLRAGLGAQFNRDIFSGRRQSAAFPSEATLLDPSRPFEAAGCAWRIVIGRGHSPELAAFYAPSLKVLISGDQVLPVITPNVSVHLDDIEADPLRLFLDSIPRFRALPADTLVLPSHQLLFYGLHERLDQMRAHHDDRLESAREACKSGATAAETLPLLFSRRLDDQQVYFALGETLAHLNYLVAAGEMTKTPTDGADIYRTQ
jgi:glyoxylase-like metal-dependent hydrolase (beta-lactamase superfamily II)